MKNVREDQIRKCIILSKEEFDKIMWKLTDDFDYTIEENIYFFMTADEDNRDAFEFAKKQFSEYFGAEVTSIHCNIVYDDSECGEDEYEIWIAYKEE